jgi:hypothetical protein
VAIFFYRLKHKYEKERGEEVEEGAVRDTTFIMGGNE